MAVNLEVSAFHSDGSIQLEGTFEINADAAPESELRSRMVCSASHQRDETKCVSRPADVDAQRWPV